MRIIENSTAYDTRAVRRVLQAIYRTFRRREGHSVGWPNMRVRLLEGRTQRIRIDAWKDLLKIYLPPLQGTEFIGLLRQQHGGDMEHDHGGVSALRLALQVQGALFGLVSGARRSWHDKQILDGKRTLRGIPELLPLKIIKPELPRDKLREKLTRTLELKKSWQRKAKLAGTKLKKLTSLQKRYEKQLARRETTV